ncbi:MAG: alpha/beta hydrolase [Actinomycetota bacterium]|nr:alpha/beta hydrolase [Actinomycetota bacterium]
MTISQKSRTEYLQQPGGRLAYDVAGDGPLVVCVPGMGDVRTVYNRLAADLVSAGYRVATMDLRGHGGSDTTFSRYDDVAAGSDMLALIAHLDEASAILVGNSMGAGAAAWAAAESPSAVVGLVLIGPFVRDVPTSAFAGVAFRLLLHKPWGPSAFAKYVPKLYPGRHDSAFDEHLGEIKENLRQPGHWKAFVATTRTSHAPVEARLGEVSAPVLVVMGEADPDFADPAGEARLIAGRLGAEVVLVPAAGHYPQAEYPEVVGPCVVEFLDQLPEGA